MLFAIKLLPGNPEMTRSAQKIAKKLSKSSILSQKEGFRGNPTSSLALKLATRKTQMAHPIRALHLT